MPEPLSAAGQTPEFLAELAALLVGGTLIAYIGARLGLVPIVAFLLAGVLIGPNSLGVITDQGVVDAAAEVGVILLLFTIGMEFSLERLARLWRAIFGGGGLRGRRRRSRPWSWSRSGSTCDPRSTPACSSR